MVERDTLIVVSVPFTRNSRYLISSPILPALRTRFDVLLVGSHFANAGARAEFEGPNTSFWAFDQTAEALPRIARRIYAVSEMVRRNGYLFRNRKRGLG